jgi:RNA polymerase sigma-70 factor (ECF subfamily)
MDQLRSANRNVTVSLTDQHEHTLTESGEHDAIDVQLQQLALVMNAITPEETRMLLLKYEEGLDIKTIAQQLSLNDSAVKMRLKRTRDKIRRLYNQQRLS